MKLVIHRADILYKLLSITFPIFSSFMQHRFAHMTKWYV